MKTFKKIRAQAGAAKANLDAAILGLRNASLEQLMSKLEETKTRLELDRDLAWNIASGVLAKVRAVRESMQTKSQKVPQPAAPGPFSGSRRVKKAKLTPVKAAPKAAPKKRLVVKTKSAKPALKSLKTKAAKTVKKAAMIRKSQKSKTEKRATR